MNDGWIALQSIPPGGTTLTLEDHPLWRGLLETFAPCRVTDPIRATVFILPQEDGVLFQGSFTVETAMPCNRCTEETVHRLSERFDAFEGYPPEPLPQPGKAEKKRPKKAAPEPEPEENPELPDEAVIRFTAHGKGIEINPAALVWEEFSLALPVKPLCSGTCKGLCPVCGRNKNTEDCACVVDEGDPRLSALRKLTVVKK